MGNGHTKVLFLPLSIVTNNWKEMAATKAKHFLVWTNTFVDSVLQKGVYDAENSAGRFRRVNILHETMSLVLGTLQEH